MSTRNLGIALNVGDDFNLVIGINGVSGPIDITGYAFKSEMRLNTDPSSPVVAEFEFTILNQTTNKGQVQWSLPNADTDSIETSVSDALQTLRQTTPFVYDVKMKDSVGNITRIIEGIVYVSPEVTMESF